MGSAGASELLASNLAYGRMGGCGKPAVGGEGGSLWDEVQVMVLRRGGAESPELTAMEISICSCTYKCVNSPLSGPPKWLFFREVTC